MIPSCFRFLIYTGISVSDMVVSEIPNLFLLVGFGDRVDSSCRLLDEISPITDCVGINLWNMVNEPTIYQIGSFINELRFDSRVNIEKTWNNNYSLAESLG